jgi:twitching motility protein PilT
VSAELAAAFAGDFLRIARERGASDLHLAQDDIPLLRIDGNLQRIGCAITGAEEIGAMLERLLVPHERERLADEHECDVAVSDPEFGVLRIHAFLSRGRTQLAIRLLAPDVPELQELGLPPIVAEFAQRRYGIVLFVGPTGSGKSTALAGLIDHINRTSERHVITIEDPIEYRHRPIRSLITQCAVGSDVANWSAAVRGALRADPNVIAIGELRDAATMQAALMAAETGHLVLTTLHTGDVTQTVDRILAAFDPATRAEIAVQLAQTLIAIVALRLVPRSGGAGRRLAAEVLVATDAVRALIRDGKTHQLRNVVLTGRSSRMQTLESHLSDLVSHREILLADALSATERPGEICAFETSEPVST